MTATPPHESPLSAFTVRTIGPEPSGATPIEQEDLEGLIPDFVATRADLNQVEFENIAKALPWAMRQARAVGPEGILDYGFMLTLHRRMFGDVWAWAGMQRWRVTNIGVPPHLITEQSQLLLDDAKLWHLEGVFGPEALAARIHCRLVSVHPFPNGNGRCTRMMADAYLISIGARPFTWGGAELGVDGSGRARYIAALIKAVDADDYGDLIRFARGEDVAGP
jgi:Fic-DOC domain mobile mystery protein B